MNAIIKANTLSQCMNAMAEYAAAYERTGGKNLIFCEDRLTLIAERALALETGGTFFSAVSTFARFLQSDERMLTKQGSVMAVGEVMTELQRENALQCFTTATGIGNNAKCIYETLAQFSASQVTPELLWESVDMLPDDSLKKKTSDLAKIYEGYSAFLQKRGYLDESQYLALLPEKIRADKSLKDTNVFFLCFNSFTAQARETIRAVLETAKNVIGVFCAGVESFYTNQAMGVFQRVCSEYGEVKILPLGKPLQTEAELLRKSLFEPEQGTRVAVQTNKIKLFEGEDKTHEAEYVAVQIRKAMGENPDLRYSDFSVLTPSVSAYSLPLKRAFSEYGIPYFVDEKKTLKSHPVSRFLLDCFKVVKERFSSNAVQSLTQNVFFGESDEYRNYLFKFANYRGGAKREIKTSEAVTKTYNLEALQSGRERLLLATKNIKARGHGRDYCFAVQKIREDFKTKETLKALEDMTADVSLKGYLSQISDTLDNVLKEAELLTAEREMTVAEFAAVLEDGLDATEISLIPLKKDAVFIGDITDSRLEKAHTLFAVGMTEEVPRCGTDTSIVSDKEIERLAEVKTMLEPTVAEVNLRSRESVCLNLCAFTSALHLSYPLSADGNEPTVSDVFRYVDAAFCDENHKPLPRCKKYSMEEFCYACSAPVPAIRNLLIEKGEYESGRVNHREKYSSLYTALDKLGVEGKEDYLAEQGEQVCVQRAEELFFKNGKISPTTLEGYFECPFRNFAERGLKLKEREETAVLALDTGNFVHELLEHTCVKAKEIETEEEMRAFAMQTGAEILSRPVYASQSDTASGSFFSEKLLKEGADVAVAAYKQIKNSLFAVEDTETNINFKEFHGKVDRVDGTEKYIRIIDYKTGKIDDSALSYYTGRKLQMQLYMSALKGERVPAGVFYFPASVDYSDDTEGRFKMRGFLNGDKDALLCGDPSITEEKPSEYFPAGLKNSRSKRVMEEDVFRDFLDYSVHVSRQGCMEIKEGFVAPTPYEKSCDYCKYGGMCGFNRDAQAPRTEPNIEPATIAKIVKKIREGEE